MGQDRKSTHQLSSQEKQSHCGENGFNLLLIIHREKKVRNQKKQKTPSTHHSSSETKLCPWITHLFLWVVQADGEWRFCSVDNTVPLPLIPFGAFSLFQWGIPPTCRSLNGCSRVCYSHGWSPSGADRSIMGSLQGHQDLSKFLLLHGLLFMGHSSHQEPSVSWAFCRLQHCRVLRGLQGNSLPHHNLHHRGQENVCVSSYSISSLSFTYRGVFRAVSLPYSHSFLKCWCVEFFLNLK